MKKSIMIMALTAIAALVLSVFATPSTALPIYQLTGTLDWNSTGGADRLYLDGKEFSMKYEITNPTPTNIPDPNGMQSYYQGLVTLSIGGGAIETDSSQASFFSNSDSSMDDGANFFLFTTSGDPQYYYPAVHLKPESNSGASVEAPLYTSGDANTAVLLVPDVEPTGVSATYAITSFRFVSAIPAEIDIKPRSNTNPVNPYSKGKVIVAILTTNDFDASMVDASSIRFGPDLAEPIRYRIDDVDDDGDWDLKLKFSVQDTGILCGDAEATLTAQLLNSDHIVGTDAIKTVGCR